MTACTKEQLLQQTQLGTGGNLPFDYEWPRLDPSRQRDISPHPRINKILKRIHNDTQDTIVSTRALLITEAYKLYDGDIGIVKAAKVLTYLLEKLPIDVYPDELIVGDLGAAPRSAQVFPEFSMDWFIYEMLNEPFEERDQDRFLISEQTKKELLEVYDYWKGRTIQDILGAMLTEDEQKGSTMPGGRPVVHPDLHMAGGIGHFAADYQKLFKDGYKGIRNDIERNLAKLNMQDADDIKKREFYNAVLMVLDAVKKFFCRYGTIARRQAKETTDDVRRAELLQMAENVEWVSENPPRTFWEALQLYHLATNVCHIESNGHSVSYGRWDMMLYPFYERDMKNGVISKDFAGELSENWCIKLYELNKIRDKGAGMFQSESGIAGTCVIIGGIGKNGRDATNDLSYIMLEAHAHTYTPDPWLGVRWHDNTPWEFKVKTVNTIKIGTGQPKIFNDEVAIAQSLSLGRTIDDSRDYTIIGCVEPSSGNGNEYGEHDTLNLNVGKVLELAINDGRCIDCSDKCPRWEKCGGAGKRLGIRSGSLADFTSFEDVQAAWMAQMTHWVRNCVTFALAEDIVHERFKPLPYVSAIIGGCIDHGVECTAGGAVYNFNGCQQVGPATVGDSLTAIKQVVFDEKRVTGAELLDALQKNWEGYEELYQYINSDKVHHYGNDDDYADDICHWSVNSVIDAFNQYTTKRGGQFVTGCLCGGGNVGMGLNTAATPDGRKAYEPISNSINPAYNIGGMHDWNGPTAMLKSVGKLDALRMNNGTLLNMKFNPGIVAGESGRDNFIHLLETMIKLRVFHVQITLQDKETLLAAQANPEAYKSLLVRVAAYSAYFTRLSPSLQNEVINRHQYDSF